MLINSYTWSKTANFLDNLNLLIVFILFYVNKLIYLKKPVITQFTFNTQLNNSKFRFIK